MMNIKYLLMSLFILLLIFLPTISTKTIFADTTTDISVNNGLELQADSQSSRQQIYLKPGVDFKRYKTIKIDDATVEFRKYWVRNYNRRQKTASYRLTDEDVAALKSRLSEQFDSTFSKYLEVKGGYSISPDTAEGTLLLKPAIIELDINAPFKAKVDPKLSIVSEAGVAKLVLEIYDASSGQLLGKIIDKKRTLEHHYFMIASRSFNKTEFIPVYKRWARKVLEVLK